MCTHRQTNQESLNTKPATSETLNSHKPDTRKIAKAEAQAPLLNPKPPHPLWNPHRTLQDPIEHRPNLNCPKTPCPMYLEVGNLLLAEAVRVLGHLAGLIHGVQKGSSMI